MSATSWPLRSIDNGAATGKTDGTKRKREVRTNTAPLPNGLRTSSSSKFQATIGANLALVRQERESSWSDEVHEDTMLLVPDSPLPMVGTSDFAKVTASGVLERRMQAQLDVYTAFLDQEQRKSRGSDVQQATAAEVHEHAMLTARQESQQKRKDQLMAELQAKLGRLEQLEAQRVVSEYDPKDRSLAVQVQVDLLDMFERKHTSAHESRYQDLQQKYNQLVGSYGNKKESNLKLMADKRQEHERAEKRIKEVEAQRSGLQLKLEAANEEIRELRLQVQGTKSEAGMLRETLGKMASETTDHFQAKLDVIQNRMSRLRMDQEAQNTIHLQRDSANIQQSINSCTTSFTELSRSVPYLSGQLSGLRTDQAKFQSSVDVSQLLQEKTRDKVQILSEQVIYVRDALRKQREAIELIKKDRDTNATNLLSANKRADEVEKENGGLRSKHQALREENKRVRDLLETADADVLKLIKLRRACISSHLSRDLP